MRYIQIYSDLNSLVQFDLMRYARDVHQRNRVEKKDGERIRQFSIKKKRNNIRKLNLFMKQSKI